jgi:pilin isopeptide linkage protein
MISFSAIPLTKAGTYTFTAYEVKGDDKDITYDEATYTYTVVVEDQDGQLTVTDVKPESDQVTFTNTYTPPEPAPTPEPTSKPKSPVHKVAIPQTGDVMASPYPMVLLGIAAVAILAGILVRKRNSSFNKSSKRGDTSMRK